MKLQKLPQESPALALKMLLANDQVALAPNDSAVDGPEALGQMNAQAGDDQGA